MLSRKYPKIRANPPFTPDDLKCFVYGQISSYVLVQLKRATEWQDGDVDLLAWVSRNLDEIERLVQHLNENVKHVYRFISEAELDDKELLEKVGATREGEPMRLKALEIAARRTEKGLALKRRELPASTAGDKATYKLQSKMVHPSAWFILEIDRQRVSAESRSMFHVFIGTAAMHILTLLMDEFQRIKLLTSKAESADYAFRSSIPRLCR